MQPIQTPRRRWSLRSGFLLVLLLVFSLGCAPMVQAAGPADPTVKTVIPLGRTAGIKLFSQGVLVVGLSDVATDRGLASPAKACGLRPGDVITHINGKKVDAIEAVQAVLEETAGGELTLRILREEAEKTLTTRAVQANAQSPYQLGAWIRDSMAGIGTLTFVDPNTGLFGTLGHGINDVDTAVLLKLQSGAITPATVAGIVKGMDGRPGELRGCFAAGRELGKLFANTPSGVFGYASDSPVFSGTPMPVARPDQVHTGPATIRCSLSGDKVEEYTVEITKVYEHPTDTRDLMLRVTDRRLLDRTGGIVQGMSGSPILQDGRMVGAVTHVLIDHADRGYGILAQHMLESANAVEKP